MHLESRKITFLGLLTACSVLLILLASLIGVSTFFFLAAAAYCIGIASEETGVMQGMSVYVATLLLSFILSPNKLYCFTYGALGLYLVILELSWHTLARRQMSVHTRNLWIFAIKFICFEGMFLPILIWFPNLIYTGTLRPIVYFLVWMVGHLLWYCFDRVYVLVLSYYKRHLRKYVPWD